ncbi:hypothetical protein BGY98DRAFT_149524 [Russula aff. rugulosa BPL654]|nr:hypothetical protein BGY98DRAFT_149524 [Russula aff. rugulosa BPL654]
MRILFFGDRRGWTIACFVDHSLPSFFFSLPCLALPCCALVDGGGESTPPLLLFFLYFATTPHFFVRCWALYHYKVKSSGPVACRLLRPVTAVESKWSKLHLFRSVLPPSPPSAVSGPRCALCKMCGWFTCQFCRDRRFQNGFRVLLFGDA